MKNKDVEEAIEYLKTRLTLLHRNYQFATEQAIEILINYIEELEKENRTLKEYIFIAPNLDEMTAIAYKNITEDAYIRGRAEEQQRAKEIIHNHYIPKQVILDKIEELKEELNYIGGCKKDCEKCFTTYRGSNFVYCYAYHQIKVLQEILKGEKL